MLLLAKQRVENKGVNNLGEISFFHSRHLILLSQAYLR